MRLNLLNTSQGLKPCYDDDFEEKKRLKIGEVYTAEIKLQRNPAFHRKFFALINTAWEFLPERTSNGFRSKDNFRKYVEVAAGWCDVFYSPKLRDWVEVPRSISFEKMDEAEFSRLYDACKDVIWGMIGRFVSVEEFDRLIDF